jgi:ATP-dependent RNA helicase DHX8/PRP22
MKRAQDVRKQLIAIMDRYKLDLVSAGKNYVRVCKVRPAQPLEGSGRRTPRMHPRRFVPHRLLQH